MSFVTRSELESMGFKKIGKDVKFSSRAVVYNPETIELDDYCRIDDFTILSGVLEIGKYVHIASHCNIAGGVAGIFIKDFVGVATGSALLSRSDDYSGETLTNPNIPMKYKKVIDKSLTIGRHALFGAGCIVLPGCDIGEGCSFGARSTITRPTIPWYIYTGTPAKPHARRRIDLLRLELELLNETLT